MKSKTETDTKMTFSQAICTQMLVAAMNATNNGGSMSPITWLCQVAKYTRFYPDEGGHESDPEMSVDETDLPHAESLTLKFSAYGHWHVGKGGEWNNGIIPFDISGEVRIFRPHKGLAWQPHYCVFMQPSFGTTKTAFAYIFRDFADSQARDTFLSSRKFPGTRNWADSVQLITDGRKDQFLSLTNHLFVPTMPEET